MPLTDDDVRWFDSDSDMTVCVCTRRRQVADPEAVHALDRGVPGGEP